MGFYKNWDKQSILIPRVTWYTVKNMIEYLHGSRLRIIDKKHTLKRIELKKVDAPLAKNLRFSNTETYICEGIGNWNIHLDLLLLAQSILNRERKLDESTFHSMGEVEMYALDKINQLLQSISCIDIVVTQERFEKMYDLVWIESKSWFFLFTCWFDDKHYMPVMVTGLFKRVDRIWHNVAQ